MSEEKPPTLANLEIQRQFGCQICFEQYSRKYRYPVSLNCGHTFCLVCIRKLGKDRNVIQCGVCRKNTYSDYKKLGKNIGFSELLEYAQLLENDENREPGPDEVDMDDPDWEGADQFISRSNLEEFFGELHLLNSMISNYFQLRNGRLQARIQQLEEELHAIQIQMRASSDTFTRMQQTLAQLHAEIGEILANQEAVGNLAPWLQQPIHRFLPQMSGSGAGPSTSTYPSPYDQMGSAADQLRIQGQSGINHSEVELSQDGTRSPQIIYRRPDSDSGDDWPSLPVRNRNRNNNHRHQRRRVRRDRDSNHRRQLAPTVRLHQFQPQQGVQQPADGDWGSSSSGWGTCDEGEYDERQQHDDQSEQETVKSQAQCGEPGPTGQQQNADWEDLSDDNNGWPRVMY